MLEISCVIVCVSEHQIVIFSVPLRVTFIYFNLCTRQQWISKSSAGKKSPLEFGVSIFFSTSFNSVRGDACEFLISFESEKKKNNTSLALLLHFTQRNKRTKRFSNLFVHFIVILNFQLNRCSLVNFVFSFFLPSSSSFYFFFLFSILHTEK